MRIIAPMIILIMMTSTLAGCTGGDPDSGGEIDSDALNDLIDANMQDFINNTTITVNQDIHHHNNTTVVNNYYNTNTEYNNTTVIDGGEVTNQNYDQSSTYYNASSIGGNNSYGQIFMVDTTFTIEDLIPEPEPSPDYRNNTFNYSWEYYDYATNEQRNDMFEFSCQVFYLVGANSTNSSNQVTYWQDSSQYSNAWLSVYNSTIRNLLQSASSTTDSISGINIQTICDENYLQDNLQYYHLVITEVIIPEGYALSCVQTYSGYYVEYLMQQESDGSWDQLWYYGDESSKYVYGDYFDCRDGLIGGLEETTMTIRGHHDMSMSFEGNYRFVFYYQLVPVVSV